MGGEEEDIMAKSLIALALCIFGFFNTLRMIAGCDVCAYLELFGEQLEVWGAALFLLAGILIATGLIRILKFLMFAWIAGHIYLIVIYYFTFEYICSDCLLLFVTEIILLIMLFKYPLENTSLKQGVVKFTGLLAVCAIITGLFLIAPEKNNNIIMTSSNQSIKKDNKDGNIITVFNVQGNEVKLDLSGKHALFFAWWCPQCTKALAKNSDLILVSTCFEKNADNERETLKKLDELGIKTDKLYFMPNDPPVRFVPAIYPKITIFERLR